MQQWVRQSLFVSIVFVTVWVMMVIYWQTSNSLPSTSEIVLYLFGVPFGLLLSVWLIRQGMSFFSAKPAVNNSDAQISQTNVVSEQEKFAKQEREWTLHIISSAIASPHGQSTDELAANLTSDDAKINLDEELIDSNGFPIFSGRIQDLDEDLYRTALDSWLISRNLPEVAWSTEQLRAVTLGSNITIELAQQAVTYPALQEYISTPPEKRKLVLLPPLHLLTALPTHWEAEKHKIATEWFTHLIEEQGWPLEKIVSTPTNTINNRDPLSIIDRFSVQIHRQDIPCLAMLVTCESYLGEAIISTWENTGNLLTGNNHNGQTPGEGAAGLLISDAEQAKNFDLESQAIIHRVSSGKREKSADSSGRISSDFLTKLVNDALTVAKIDAEKVTFIASDTDHRASRNAELLEMAYVTFPELDLLTQCLKGPAKCGSAGNASSVTALALAHHAASYDSTHALYVSNQDPFTRTAVILSPIEVVPEQEITTT
ncbi:hypothetical protein [Sulfurirhabdus autotrophica]|uniref:3-oxoacyl-(Acyl-carrier-protein) synthase n=1 Tax=Sulfurirhabdus autotrophica TaxID=1706046 RepID=A0A4R3XSY5_9PROT|nr:hypothetical protein [Sulfurirhabdus autotrophica]TCV81093.1 hypothetical protein EDC63_12611 [Sulfurirhabdus autotrophica]